MDTIEKQLTDRLAALKAESKELNEKLRQHRASRARDVRALYFGRKMNQVQLAEAFSIGQASISRIISDISYADVNSQLRGGV